MKSENRSIACQLPSALMCAATLLCFAVGHVHAVDKRVTREEGQFKVFAAGKEIGSEKYVILSSEDAASSTSMLDFRNPGDRHQKVQIETKLEMDGNYLPRTYQLKSDVEGQKGTIIGTFSDHQAMFEYIGSGNPRKSGLLVGDRYTVLDTNLFHHFVFLTRLFKYGSEKDQRFEVVIPQEQDNGVLRISEIGKENIAIRGKKIEACHLQADSGSVLIHLWVDGQKVLQRITVPSREIEVVRNP